MIRATGDAEPSSRPIHAGLWAGRQATPPNRELFEEINNLYRLLRETREELAEVRRELEVLSQ